MPLPILFALCLNTLKYICWAIVINLSLFCYPKLSLDTGSILNFGGIDVSSFQYESEKVKVKSLSRGLESQKSRTRLSN